MRGVFLFALAAMALSSCEAQQRVENRGWGAYGGTPEHIQYSSLDQITPQNVANLAVAWTYDTGEDPKAGTMHSTPLLADGVLYLAGPTGAVHALNPATGQRLWRTEINPPDSSRSGYWRGAPRGLMYWRASDESRQRRIYTLAGRYVVALNAATGAIETSFGNNGRIDLHENLGRDPALMDAEMSSPGVIYKDLLIIGSRVGEQMPTAPGHIRAYDVRTGALRWTFHTIPYPGEPGYETWPRDAWTYSGGANSWSGMSLDEKRGMVFLSTGSAASDFYGADRTGDNLYANCVLALNAETGALVWHQQLVRHDLWDRDAPAPPVLVTLQHEGRNVDAVVQATKSGHIWVFNRETGESLFPIEEVAAPPSTIPGEHAAPTQRTPTRPVFMRQTFTADDLTDRTPAAHAAALAAFNQLEPHGSWTPPSLRGRIMWPGYDGGAEWGGGAFDPASGVFYVNANEVPWILRLVENRGRSSLHSASDVYAAYCASCHGADRAGSGEFPSLVGVGERQNHVDIVTQISGGGGRMPAFASALHSDVINALADYLENGRNASIGAGSIPSQPYDTRFHNDGYPKFLDPDGYPASKPPWGTLTAINLNTGEQVWRRPLGQYPELVAQGLADTGSENYGGPVVTAGGVIFIAATLHDRKIRAFDKTTGALLWEHVLPAAGVATPAVYEAEGREFVVIAAGGPRTEGMTRGATYFTFALPLR